MIQKMLTQKFNEKQEILKAEVMRVERGAGEKQRIAQQDGQQTDRQGKEERQDNIYRG